MISPAPVNIYPYETPRSFRWDYVYLHGDAENVYKQPRNAPDLFKADRAMPKEECNCLCMIMDQPALAVVRYHMGKLGGRVALLSDTEGLKHVLSPEEWL